MANLKVKTKKYGQITLNTKPHSDSNEIALADGERQVFPRQTNSIFRYLESAILDCNKANE